MTVTHFLLQFSNLQTITFTMSEIPHYFQKCVNLVVKHIVDMFDIDSQ